jgi:hypothetical protein
LLYFFFLFGYSVTEGRSFVNFYLSSSRCFGSGGCSDGRDADQSRNNSNKYLSESVCHGVRARVAGIVFNTSEHGPTHIGNVQRSTTASEESPIGTENTDFAAEV